MTITAPAGDSVFAQGQSIAFSCTAVDPQDGPIDNADIAWSSDREGALGVGAEIQNALLTDGVHAVTCTATDVDGNTGSDTITVTVLPNLPPTVTIAAPADNAFFLPSDAITFTGSANDAEDGAILGADLRWLDNGALLGAGATVGTALPLGDHVITLEATDSAGVVGTATITIHVVDNLPPVCTIAEPNDGATFVEGDSVTFSASCDDPDGGGAVIANADYRWDSDLQEQLGFGSSVTQGLVVVGAHRVTVCATDTTDPLVEGCRSITINVVVNQPAVCAVAAPANGTTIDADQVVTFIATATDPEGQAFTVTWSSSLSGDLGTGAVLSRLMPNGGAHSITCTATDARGAASTSAAITLNVTSPVARITQPANNTTVLEGTPITFAGTGFDAEDGALSGASLEWFDNGQIGTGSPITATLAPGTHDVLLLVRDSAANIGSATVRVVVNPNLPPVVTVTDPQNNASFAACTPVQLRCDANDPENGNVTFAWTSNRVGEPQPLSTNRDFTWSPQVSGAHVLTCTATDSAGKVAAQSVAVTVDAVTATIAAPTDGAIFDVGENVSFFGSACATPNTNLFGGSLVWTTNNPASQIGTGNFFSTNTLVAGNHTVTLTASSGGNTATDVVNIIVNTAPVVTITSANAVAPPANPTAMDAAQTLTLTGTATDAEDGDITASAVWSDNTIGAFATGGAVAIGNLLVGKHVITYTVTDAVGVSSSSTLVVNVTSGGVSLVASGGTGNVGQTNAAVLDPNIGKLWVATSAGLQRMDPATRNVEIVYTTVNSDLPGNTINDVVVLADGTLAVGTTNGGAAFCSEVGLQLVCSQTFADGDLNGQLNSNNIRTIGQLADGTLLLGTSSCLVMAQFVDAGFFNNVFNDYCDGDGGGDGLNANNDTIVDIAIDTARDQAWIATESRVHRLVPSTANILDRGAQNFTQYDTGDGLPSNVIRRTAVAASGDVWFATNAGAARLQNPGGVEVITVFAAAAGVPSNDVRDVAIDTVFVNGADREIAWFATAGGLGRVDPLVPSAIAITTADGLPSNNLRTVTIDAAHVKYLGTTNGVVIYRGL